MLSKHYESTKVDFTAYALEDSLVHRQWHSPSSWNMKRYFYKVVKMKSDASKVPKQAKAKRDCVINPQNYNFYQF